MDPFAAELLRILHNFVKEFWQFDLSAKGKPAMLYIILTAYAYLVFVNLLTFAAFAYDKHRAQTERRRVREAHLIALAVSGGWLGAKLGQAVFRHKTMKYRFGKTLNAIPLLHAIMATAAFVGLTTLSA